MRPALAAHLTTTTQGTAWRSRGNHGMQLRLKPKKLCSIIVLYGPLLIASVPGNESIVWIVTLMPMALEAADISHHELSFFCTAGAADILQSSMVFI